MTNKTILSKALMLLLLAVFASSLYSCKDSDEDIITYYDTYIEGYIKDFHTGEPVAGVIFDADYITTSRWTDNSYFAKNIAVSNSEGYYKIKIPKHRRWQTNSGGSNVDFIEIQIHPRKTENYNFEVGIYNYQRDSISIKNKTIDISPITYGYLKVILPKTSKQEWGFWNYNSTFETPYFKPIIVITESYNDNLNYFLFKVPASSGTVGAGNNAWTPIGFTIDNPRDTVTLYVDME